VAEGRGHGYIQRPFSHRNHNYFAREFHGDHGRFVRFGKVAVAELLTEVAAGKVAEAVWL
ncbi:MAG TPA: hypothetical protein VEU96_07150, partial [Bryobacteraceae bacterium]|nr:hypothetical protein [Bryobacteraceae bacterium]